MAVTHHPDSRFLNDYAAGSLPTAHALCVATHLAYCPQCRAQINQLSSVGGALLEQLAPTAVSGNLLDRVMATIEQRPTVSVQHKVAAQPLVETDHDGPLPDVIQKLAHCDITSLTWRRISNTLKLARLATGDKRHEAALYNIRAGGKVPPHRHKGTEITVVLRGSFSDHEGVYRNGDFIVREPGDHHHSPTATQDDDCLCLAVLDEPIRFTGFYRLLNPFLRVQPG